ncbi:uncharacterized protein LOC123672388 [Harmonia axyridis]|uniref:uncharacterized protein LOC123672388 n=1 Tax=Harmonia axyridis TaxID=115357 RepID=UPI001E2786F4|nr:uncharacterized protein LOC123672388 [Harmonia axyridis]
MSSDDVDTRWAVITKQKLCFSCLRRNHQTMKCRARRQCSINGCKRSHHQLLHKDTQRSIKDTDTHSTQTEFKNNENVLAVGHGEGNVLLRMVKVKLYGNNTVLETVALCEEVSSVTLVDKSIANRLGLNGTPQPLCIQWTNNLASRHEDSSCLNIEILGVFDGAKIFSMKNVRTVQNSALPIQEIRKSDWERYSYLSGIPFHEIGERPMILLGQDNVRLTVARKVIQSTENLPIATKTNLGWVLHGGNCIRQEKQVYSFHICSSGMSDDSLHEMVKQSFTTDAFGVVPMKTNVNKAEQRAMEIMKNTIRRVGNRFEIGLLWKEDDIHLPESKTIAIQRLRCVEKQIQKDREFGKRYSEKITSYVEKGYARKLTPAESNEEGPQCWYLPHFGVINPNKPKKLRLVFDAASKSNGTSLNDNLLSGPDLLQSLVEVLIKFRQRKIGFCSDVREMFHQVMVRKEDQSSQRFLWRDGDTNRQWDVYEMQVMTFGATCSPTCAQFEC